MISLWSNILQAIYFILLQMSVLVSWINHLPPARWSTFWKSNFKQQLGCRFDIMDNKSYFFVFWHMQFYMSWFIRSFSGFTFLNILYFFRNSCTNIFHRRSFYTFYWKQQYRLWLIFCNQNCWTYQMQFSIWIPKKCSASIFFALLNCNELKRIFNDIIYELSFSKDNWGMKYDYIFPMDLP